jgi:quercetin dioxygenase-like cupin family protein
MYTWLELLQSAPQVPADGILSRTLFEDAQLKVVWFGFGAGQELSEHTASMPAVIQILSGEAQVSVGGDVHAARPGSWVHLPAHLPHRVRAHTPLILLLLLLKPPA